MHYFYTASRDAGYMSTDEGSTQIKYPGKDGIIYFLHIPKTAGMTLSSILDDQFDSTSIFPLKSWEDLLRLSPNKIYNYQLIRGHFGYFIHRILPKFPTYVTVLRDPVEQLLSLFDMYKRNPPIGIIDFFSKNDSILDFINDPYYKSRLKDMQTRYVGLDIDIKDLKQKLEERCENQFCVTTLNEFLFPNLSDDELIKTAKTHLDKFSFIGLVERFDESIYLLCYTFGWRPIKNPVKINVATRKTFRKDLPKETLEKILECVQLDMKLYEYSKQIFDKRFSAMIEDLKKKYYEPRFDNLSFSDMMEALLEKNYEERYSESSIEVTTPINFNFSQSLPHSGWYTHENHGTGIFFRWSGPETTSSIDFPRIKGNDLIIQIRILMSIKDNIPRNLKLLIDNNPIGLKILHQNDGRYVLEGIIPKSVFTNQRKFTRLTFIVPNTISPHSLNPISADTRKLGVAIDQIKLIPHSTQKVM